MLGRGVSLLTVLFFFFPVVCFATTTGANWLDLLCYSVFVTVPSTDRQQIGSANNALLPFPSGKDRCADNNHPLGLEHMVLQWLQKKYSMVWMN